MSEFRPVLSIETTRLLLACWRVGDAVALTEALHESREHLLPWMPWAEAEPEPVEAKLELILDWREAHLEGRDFHFAIFAREDGQLLGVLGLHPRIGPGALEIGYWVRSSAVGRGVATEASAAAARVALEVMGAHRVEIRMDSRNTASERIPIKLGLQREGLLRESTPAIDGVRGDSLIYAVLARELASSPVSQRRVRVLGLDKQVLLDDLEGPSS